MSGHEIVMGLFLIYFGMALGARIERASWEATERRRATRESDTR